MSEKQTQGQPPLERPEFWKQWHKYLGRNLELLLELWRAQERNEAIMHLCPLDDNLEQLLRAVMIQDKSVDQLMSDSQALQPFGVKRKLAYALGLLPETVNQDLKYLNKIRNEFAHNDRIRSFGEPPIATWCRELSTAQIKEDDGAQVSPRDAHAIAVIKNLMFLIDETEYRRREKAQSQSAESRHKEERDLWAKLRWADDT